MWLQANIVPRPALQSPKGSRRQAVIQNSCKKCVPKRLDSERKSTQLRKFANCYEYGDKEGVPISHTQLIGHTFSLLITVMKHYLTRKSEYGGFLRLVLVEIGAQILHEFLFLTQIIRTSHEIIQIRTEFLQSNDTYTFLMYK